MFPTIGRILHYTLSEIDAQDINRRRTSGGAIAARVSNNPPTWPEGVQAHIGVPVKAGDVVPLLVTRVDGTDLVSGQCVLNGTDTLWVTNRCEGTTDGFWVWPPKAK